MIFLDTSAIYALADRADLNHQNAKTLFDKALHGGEGLLIHNYILIEAAALIHHRLGFAPAKKFLKDVAFFQTVWVDAFLHEAGTALFLQSAKRRVSFVDCVSFALMRQKGIKAAFAFDDDFLRAGFQIYS